LIDNVTDLPPGTLGFRASGKVTSDEYRQLMEPIYATLERGEKLNIYFELADDFDGLDLGAMLQDVKAAGSVGPKYRERGSHSHKSRGSTPCRPRRPADEPSLRSDARPQVLDTNGATPCPWARSPSPRTRARGRL
jgi:hypothetical protein